MAAFHQDPGIQVTAMSQLALAVDREDDWTGLTDAAARRKRQNRLNVRAYRRRKTQRSQAVSSSLYAPPVPSTSNTQLQQAWWNEDKQMVVAIPASFAKTFYSTIKPILPNPLSILRSEQAPTGILFPLSSDHLITLIQYNVLRACLANIKLLDLVDATRVQQECGSAPTLLQRTIEHQPWIDIIPHPTWRDNLILAQGTYDVDDICNDVVGGLWDEVPGLDVTERGIIAWSPPWDIGGWEASEGFLKKWGWLLRGCSEVVEATNRWRRMRGEEDLVVELE
ncbi:hypothetical protein N431DRAFT_544159 [Stipitochalara longipes BDJ]|nr:hypothetical protein N431DRAFT_544159 [Stipitochalara longipes BDJ]